jgi:hypothetical protein
MVVQMVFIAYVQARSVQFAVCLETYYRYLLRTLSDLYKFLRYSYSPGVDVMITFVCDFRQFCKNAYFFQTNVIIQIIQKLTVDILTKTHQFFRHFLGENIDTYIVTQWHS